MNAILRLALLLAVLLAVPLRAEERFSIDVADAPARAFFLGLAKDTPYDMLVHPEVAGRVTLRLQAATIEEALESVRELYGYDYRKVAKGFVVLPATVQTRVFQIDYLDLERIGSSRTRVSSGQVTQGSTMRDDQMSPVAAPDPAMAFDTRRTAETTGSSIYTQHRADFWSELEANLRTIVGAGPDRSVVIHRQSGLVQVRATPAALQDVAEYLRRVQSTVTRQVVLEARIVEVELDDAYQAGINWTVAAQSGGRNYFGGQNAPTSFEGDLLDNGIDRTVTVGPGNPITSFTREALGGAFTLALDFGDFNAFIELLKTQGEARVLSSPRVSTLHNQKAVIKAGSDEFFVTDVSSSTVTGTASATNRDVELTPFFSGVALDVTPQIGEDGMVLLHIHPTVSDVRDQTKGLTVAGVTDEIPLAFSEIRESDSIVRARSGQVIVIGGLMRESRRSQRFKTPILGDIPLAGRLFRSERDVMRKTELVILLRPTVITQDSQWTGLTAEPADPRAGKR